MQDGIELAARFAFPPNRLRYCGGKSFQKKFALFLQYKLPASSLAPELKHFRAHYSYLKLIARKNRLKPFDKRVVEALWIGNSLLEKVKKKDLQDFITRDLCAPGLLSRSRAFAIASSIPSNATPHHSFHPLFIGSASGVLEKNLANANNCMVSWGKIKSITGSKAAIAGPKIIRKGKNAILSKPVSRRILLASNGISFSDFRKGDLVAVHWGFAVKKISPGELARLKKYTMQNIGAVQ